MEISLKHKLDFLLRSRVPDFIKKNPAGRFFFFFLVSSAVLFSGCDMLGGSIKDFIGFNTGIPRASFVGITSATNLSRVNGIYIHYPVPGLKSIDFEVSISNPDNYDLKLTPVIYDYIDPLGNHISDPVDKPISLGKPIGNDVPIRIENVIQGDSFKIRLDMATADGTRVFEPFTGIPQIIYDTRLDPADKLGITYGPPSTATWTIPSDTEHAFIKKMIIDFSSLSSKWSVPPWTYQRDSVSGPWTTTDPIALSTGQLTSTKNNDGTTTFVVNYPVDGTMTEKDFNDNYNLGVSLEDKNGMPSTVNLNGINDRLQIGLTIYYRIPNMDGSLSYSPPRFSMEKLDRKTYTLIIPYEASGLKFEAAKTDENQKIYFEPSNSDSTIAERGTPLTGDNQNILTIRVDWIDPLDPDNSDSKNSIQYTFKVIRLSPSRDSTLKDLRVINKVAGTAADLTAPTDYLLTPVFVKPSGSAIQTDVPTYYTVNVPSTVSSISILCDYLSTSTIYNEKGSTDGTPNWNGGNYKAGDTIGDPHYKGIKANSGAINAINSPVNGDWCYDTETDTRWNYENNAWKNSGLSYSGVYYDGYYLPDYGDVGDITGVNQLEIRKGGWNYPVSQGANLFYINVKPEADDTQTRTYTVMVIKADPNDNQGLRLSSLGVSAGVLSPVFNSNILSYTVNVPYGTSSVTLSAAADTTKLSNARISEISSDLNPQPEYAPGYLPGKSVENVTISGINPGESKLITLKVNGDSDDTFGSLPRNYLVRINGCIPALKNTPGLTGADSSLKVDWTAALNNSTSDKASYQLSAYEVCYSYSTNSDAENATWRADFGSTVTSATLTGLLNQKYNVWVRPKIKTADGILIPGDWIKAQTVQTKPGGTTLSYGIPGAAEMKTLGLTFTPNSVSYVLSQQLSPSILNYNLSTVWDTNATSLTITVNYTYVDETGTVLSKSSPLTVPATGTTGTTTITVYSPDGTTSNPYTFNLTTMPKPVTVSLTPQTRSIQVSWNSVYGADHYEVFYGTTNNVNTANQLVVNAPLPSPLTTLIPGLNNGTLYNVWVRGVSSSNVYGDFSAVKTETPANGSLSITITLNDIPTQDLLFSEPLVNDPANLTLSWAGNTNFKASINTGSSFEWRIDDTLQPETGNTLIRTATQFSQKIHSIAVKVTLNGSVYSKTVNFTVGS